MTNNQGIAHLALRTGGFPLCRNRNAFISVAITDRANEAKVCKRCAAKAEKSIELSARRAQQREVAQMKAQR